MYTRSCCSTTCRSFNQRLLRCLAWFNAERTHQVAAAADSPDVLAHHCGPHCRKAWRSTSLDNHCQLAHDSFEPSPSAPTHRLPTLTHGIQVSGAYGVSDMPGNQQKRSRKLALKRYLGQSTTLRTQQSGAGSWRGAPASLVTYPRPTGLSRRVGADPTRRPRRKPPYE